MTTSLQSLPLLVALAACSGPSDSNPGEQSDSASTGDSGGQDSAVDDSTGELSVCESSQFGSSTDDYAQGVGFLDGIVYVGGQRGCSLADDGRKATSCTAFLRAVDVSDPDTPLWEANLDSSDIDTNDQVRGVAVSEDAVYVVGQTDGDLTPPCEPLTGTTPVAADEDGNAFLIRYPLSPTLGDDGEPLCDWYDLFGTSKMDEALAVAVRGDDLWVTGGTLGTLGDENSGDEDAFVRHVDLAGAEPPCTYQFGGVLFEESMAVATVDGGALAVGWTANELQPGADRGAEDVFVVHVDSACEVQWLRQFGTDSQEAGQGIAVHEEDSGFAIYVAGRTEGAMNPDEDVDPSTADNDQFVARLEWDGTSMPTAGWVHQFGTDTSDGAGVALTDEERVYLIGVELTAGDHLPSSGAENIVITSFAHDGSPGETVRLDSTDGQTDEAVAGTLVGTVLVVAGMTAGTLGSDSTDPGESELRDDALWSRLSTNDSCD